MLLVIEKWLPLVSSVVAACVYYFVPSLRNYVFPETITNLLSAIVTVGGVAVGFLATTKSVLISIDDRPIIKRIKDAGIYRRVLAYLRSAIAWSFFLTVAAAAALLFDFRGLTAWDNGYAIGTAIIIAASVGSIVSYFRVARSWYAILEHIDMPPP